MNIYIDESGSFVSANEAGSWNAIAALVVPETGRTTLDKAIADLKRRCGRHGAKEVKINEVPEHDFLAFVQQLAKAGFLLFSVGTDAGLNTPDSVAIHQAKQVEKILEHVDKMIYPEGREGVELLARQVKNLSPQLYVQLSCQVRLMYDVVAGSITYFAQVRPTTLGAFRWKVDQKNITKSAFEDAFEKITPALLQSMSIRRPMIGIKGLDYRAMKKYEFAPGDEPIYLRDQYGINLDDYGWNVNKIIRENLVFVDSKEHIGVQAVDLLVSGIRRCLRLGFKDNLSAARLLGALMLRPLDERADNGYRAMTLLSFGVDAVVGPGADQVIREMRRRAKSPLHG
ncbi:DUF3800 domain-containing protein [Burkholderia gladioli]|uniref:DUF3800 domain-containing protein n=1 Tax=Burkholderia gladioli TaxID=28095 RepID=UPI00265B46EE|nr:DUF3800 domain-containing protein [Burkholderia gladioli]